jgi:predicted Zn finger-like uncharacterized protein
LNVTCPGCSTRYAVPPRLLGPSGARVCCPACWLTFLLGPDGELAAVLGHGEAAELPAPEHSNGEATELAGFPGEAPSDAEAASDPPPAGGDDPALEVVRALDEPAGALAAAAAAGRLFAEHGAALATAFEALQRELPGTDVAAAFRAALLDVAGVELTAAALGQEMSSFGKV